MTQVPGIEDEEETGIMQYRFLRPARSTPSREPLNLNDVYILLIWLMCSWRYIRVLDQSLNNNDIGMMMAFFFFISLYITTPLLFVFLRLGQYLKYGIVSLFNLAPLLSGVGIILIAVIMPLSGGHALIMPNILHDIQWRLQMNSSEYPPCREYVPAGLPCPEDVDRCCDIYETENCTKKAYFTAKYRIESYEEYCRSTSIGVILPGCWHWLIPAVMALLMIRIGIKQLCHVLQFTGKSLIILTIMFLLRTYSNLKDGYEGIKFFMLRIPPSFENIMENVHLLLASEMELISFLLPFLLFIGRYTTVEEGLGLVVIKAVLTRYGIVICRIFGATLFYGIVSKKYNLHISCFYNKEELSQLDAVLMPEVMTMQEDTYKLVAYLILALSSIFLNTLYLSLYAGIYAGELTNMATLLIPTEKHVDRMGPFKKLVIAIVRPDLFSFPIIKTIIILFMAHNAGFTAYDFSGVSDRFNGMLQFCIHMLFISQLIVFTVTIFWLRSYKGLCAQLESTIRNELPTVLITSLMTVPLFLLGMGGYRIKQYFSGSMKLKGGLQGSLYGVFYSLIPQIYFGLTVMLFATGIVIGRLVESFDWIISPAAWFGPNYPPGVLKTRLYRPRYSVNFFHPPPPTWSFYYSYQSHDHYCLLDVHSIKKESERVIRHVRGFMSEWPSVFETEVGRRQIDNLLLLLSNAYKHGILLPISKETRKITVSRLDAGITTPLSNPAEDLISRSGITVDSLGGSGTYRPIRERARAASGSCLLRRKKRHSSVRRKVESLTGLRRRRSRPIDSLFHCGVNKGEPGPTVRLLTTDSDSDHDILEEALKGNVAMHFQKDSDTGFEKLSHNKNLPPKNIPTDTSSPKLAENETTPGESSL